MERLVGIESVLGGGATSAEILCSSEGIGLVEETVLEVGSVLSDCLVKLFFLIPPLPEQLLRIPDSALPFSSEPALHEVADFCSSYS